MNEPNNIHYEIIDDSLSFKELFHIILNYKYLIISLVIISILLGLSYVVFFTTPVYEAWGELLLKPTQQSVLNDSYVYQSSHVMQSRINDALIRIKGTGITDSVIVETNSFAHIFLEKNKRNKIQYFEASPPEKTLFLHVLPITNNMREFDYLVIDDNGNEIGKGIFNQRFTSPQLSMTLWNMQGIESFDIVLEPLTIVRERFLNALSLINYRDSNVIKFSYRSLEPNRAKNIVNIYMREFSYRNLLDKREEASALRSFLEEQFIKVSYELDSSEKKYLNFKEDSDVVSLDEQTTQYIQLLRFLEEKRIDYQIRLAEARAARDKNEAILKGSPEFDILSKFAASPSFQENSVFSELYNKIAELQIENARLTAEFNPSHPLVIQNNAELAAARNKLQEVISTRIDDATKGIDPFLKPVIENQLVHTVNIEVYQTLLSQVRNEIRTIENQLDKLPEIGVNQAQIERDLSINEQTYNQLQTRLQEASIMEGSTINDVEVINWAELPDRPVAPSKMKILLASVFGGFFLSVVCISGIEFFRKSFNSVDEVEKELQFPVLSVIPRIDKLRKDGRSLIIQPLSKLDRETSQFNDLFNSAFVNTQIYGNNNKQSVYIITSALPKEGKSIIVANMAVASSLTNHKVLVMDCDFRNPVQHKIFKTSDELGLFDYINLNAAKVIKQSNFPNLYVMSPGHVDIKEVLVSKKQRELFLEKIEKLQELFDYIFIDTSPVHVYSDTSLLTSILKNVIFVMKIDTDKDAIKRAFKMLDGTKANIQGIIVNDMHTSQFSGKSYARYSYNTYGYGYSQ